MDSALSREEIFQPLMITFFLLIPFELYRQFRALQWSLMSMALAALPFNARSRFNRPLPDGKLPREAIMDSTSSSSQLLIFSRASD